jgi:DNA-binding protein HU-beta
MKITNKLIFLTSLLAFLACDDDLLTVQDPARYTSPDLDGALDAVANGVEGDLYATHDGFVAYSALASDEYQHTGTWAGWDDVDRSLYQMCNNRLRPDAISDFNPNIESDKSSADDLANTILDALKNDDSVKIAGFGTYKVAKRKARIGRNPRTGEQIQIAASQKVKFLPAKALKEIFNK